MVKTMNNMSEEIQKSAANAAMMKAIAAIANLFQNKSNAGTGVTDLIQKREDPSIVADALVALEEAAIYGFILNKFQDETFLQELKDYKEQKEQEVG